MTIKVQVVVATERTFEVEVEGNPESANETEAAIEKATNMSVVEIEKHGKPLDTEIYVEFWKIDRGTPGTTDDATPELETGLGSDLVESNE